MKRALQKRLMIFVLVFAMLAGYAPIGNIQVEARTKHNVEITNLILNYNNLATDQTLNNNITVTGAGSDSLRLQFYSKYTKEWTTVARFDLSGKSHSENVTITFPNQWKSKARSLWRLYLPETTDHNSYTSKTITINTINLTSLDLASKAASIMRLDDATVLYNKNMHTRLANASTTKLLTSLLVMEKIKNYNKVVTFSKKAARTPYGSLKASKGTKYRARDLFNVMLTYSSNDAANALGEYVGRTLPKFMKKMNKKAKALGCKNTHFVNPQGLPHKKHYSSAYDLSLIHRQCLKYDIYKRTLQMKSCTIRELNKKKRRKTFLSTDILLGTPGFQGGKTGHAKASGHCFSGVYTFNGETYIFTVLGSKTSQGRWDDCQKLMQYIRTYY